MLLASALRRVLPSSVAAAASRGPPRRGLFIQTAETPNPDGLKFIPLGTRVLPEGHGTGAHFGSVAEARVSPLATQLMRLDGVKNVFFGPDFLTVTKSDSAVWAALRPQVFEAVMDFFASGKPIITEAPPPSVRPLPLTPRPRFASSSWVSQRCSACGAAGHDGAAR
jgi:hypothetical protein